MRIRVTDGTAAVDLSEFLRARVGAIVEQTGSRPGGPFELQVSLLGSYSEQAHREEIEAAVRRWSMLEGRDPAGVELE